MDIYDIVLSFHLSIHPSSDFPGQNLRCVLYIQNVNLVTFYVIWDYVIINTEKSYLFCRPANFFKFNFNVYA